MDPISLIVAAIVTGSAAALKSTADTAVRDAYGWLKDRLRRRLSTAGDPDEVARVEGAPEDTAPLRARLGDTGAGDDAEVLAAARRVLELADPEGSAAGKYRVTVTGGKGVVVGDHANVTMNFGDDG